MSGIPQNPPDGVFSMPAIPLDEVRVVRARQSRTKGLGYGNELTSDQMEAMLEEAMCAVSLGLGPDYCSQYPVYVDPTGKVLPCRLGARLYSEGERERDTSKASLVYILREMAYQRLHALGVPMSFLPGVGVSREGKGGSTGIVAPPVPVTDPLFIDSLLVLEGVTRVTCPDMERRKRLFKTLCTDRHF
ncbi:hypothetical protein KIPB_009979, partial [Kipferlia bialata]|eukprot:g9979.t1